MFNELIIYVYNVHEHFNTFFTFNDTAASLKHITRMNNWKDRVLLEKEILHAHFFLNLPRSLPFFESGVTILFYRIF